jgi:hypothetical protein
VLTFFAAFPPSEEDGEHARDGDGNPDDPKEEASRNPLDAFEGKKWDGKIYYNKEEKPAYPPPQGLSHCFTSDERMRTILLVAMRTSFSYHTNNYISTVL